MDLLSKCAASLVVSALTVAGVSADIRWLEKDHDFGLMKEVAGPKTGMSRFVNTGPDTVSIVEVRPSCGCTSAEFTEDALAPGDTAVIRYTYDPAMRPGKFAKHVMVTLSDGRRKSIAISGNVLGTPESLATLYPVEAGRLRLSDAVLSLGEVTWGRSPVTFVNAYILSADSVMPAATCAAKGVGLKQSSRKAGPGDVVTFSISFDSRAAGHYGDVEIPVKITDGADGDVTVPVRAFVVPDVEYLAMRQQGKSPVANITPTIVELGERMTGGALHADITVRNGGGGPLNILAVGSKSEALSFGKLPKPVKPGKTARIRMDVDINDLPSGPFRIPIIIVTDDPAHPVVTIHASGLRQ